MKKKGVYAFKADTTLKDDPATIDLENIYQESVPVTIFFMPGRTVPQKLTGIAIGGKLTDLLKKLPDAAVIEDPNEKKP